MKYQIINLAGTLRIAQISTQKTSRTRIRIKILKIVIQLGNRWSKWREMLLRWATRFKKWWTDSQI